MWEDAPTSLVHGIQATHDNIKALQIPLPNSHYTHILQAQFQG